MYRAPARRPRHPGQASHYAPWLAATSLPIPASRRLTRNLAGAGQTQSAIRALLKRNMALADFIGFRGTTAYLIGQFRVETSLDFEGFAAAVKDTRGRQKAER